MLAAQPSCCSPFGDCNSIGVVCSVNRQHLLENRKQMMALCEAIAAVLPNDESASVRSPNEVTPSKTRSCSASVTFRASPGRALHGFHWSEPGNTYFTYPYKVRQLSDVIIVLCFCDNYFCLMCR